MDIFKISSEKMNTTSSTFTLNEIYQQPSTWLKTLNQIKTLKSEIQSFINNIIKHDDFDIVLTGAGTSEFVGNSLYSYLNTKFNYKVKSYSTTDIVASPENYLSKTKPTLLISYGRSGNSPESIGAVNIANKVCRNLYHLFITCNKNGSLSKMAEELDNCYAINLSDETHDQSFAMTSSFSNMYLATYLIFNLDTIDEKELTINNIAKAVKNFLTEGYKVAEEIVNKYDFERIVYLGSNVLKGISQESSLKMLELTAGQTVAIYDTPLGFRHGPKSIINNSTLTVIYVSDIEYTKQYEIDLIKEISSQRKENKLALVINNPSEELASLVDYSINFNISKNLNNVELGLAYITFAQTLAVLKSLKMNLTPDNPCPSGEVNRVVKGVTLYPYK